jgi:hypothetical protein
MSKVVTLQAQQRWDYCFECRRTETSLITLLADLGQQGWELVTAMPYKDAKGIMTWGAFLKRPSAGPVAAPAQHAAAPAAAPAADEKPAPLQGFDLDGEEFAIKSE